MILLLSFLHSFKLKEQWDIVEFFGGESRLTKLSRYMGKEARAMSLDIYPVAS